LPSIWAYLPGIWELEHFLAPLRMLYKRADISRVQENGEILIQPSLIIEPPLWVSKLRQARFK
jgi:hypothetical protein